MGSLDGRVALVTGAGRGIGREEALFFAAEGAEVVVNDPGVSPDGSGGDAVVVDEIHARGGTAVASTDSVSDWQGARRIVDTAAETFGDLHIVVNNAAVSRPRALVNMTEEEFDDVVAVKLKGTYAVSRWAARYWRQRYEAGVRADRAIVNTSSTSGLDSPYPLNTNYAAANAGVGAMTIVHSLELGRYGVRVNCLSPGARTRLSLDLPAGLQSLTQETPEPGERRLDRNGACPRARRAPVRRSLRQARVRPPRLRRHQPRAARAAAHHDPGQRRPRPNMTASRCYRDVSPWSGGRSSSPYSQVRISRL